MSEREFEVDNSVLVTRSLMSAVLKYLQRNAQPDSVYGFFCGGDPRDFTPDTENTKKELALHKKHCKLAEKGAIRQDAAGQWVISEGHVSHILHAKYGTGIQVWRDREAEDLIKRLNEELGYARKDHPVPEG